MSTKTNWAAKLARVYRKKSGVVDLFGIVLYTDAHPHVKKVLADEDYWRALDEITGPRWTIFSIRPAQGARFTPSPPPGEYAWMAPVWKEPSENKELLDFFEIKSTQDLPVLLVFNQGPKGEILKLTLPIDEQSQETTYTTLKKSISLVTEAVEKISPDNFKNSEGVYQAIETAVDSQRRWELYKKGLRFAVWVKDLLS